MADNANSLGHQMSHAAQLDGHFALCQAEYEAMVRAVGIPEGAHVLDGGCGTGVFLPLLADIVGSNGKVSAIDMAPESVERANELVRTLQLERVMSVQEGDLTQLEFPDNTFDAVWCANVTQYLSDEQMAIVLNEMIRVVKPRGLIAIKEFEITSWQYQPSPPDLFPRLFEANRKLGMIQTRGSFRPLQFRTWYHNAGLDKAWMKNFVSETQAPLRATDKKYLQGILGWLANHGLEADVPESDKAVWRQLADVEADDHILNRPDFYAREIHILAVGTKPSVSGVE